MCIVDSWTAQTAEKKHKHKTEHDNFKSVEDSKLLFNHLNICSSTMIFIQINIPVD